MSPELDMRMMKDWIALFNEGSDNTEYERGQIELAVALLGYTEDNAAEAIDEIYNWRNERETQ
jgi:hypothetical protein